MVEVAEIVLYEADEPDIIAHLTNADPLAREDDAQVDGAPVVAGRRRVSSRNFRADSRYILYIPTSEGAAMSDRAKLFKSGGSQAVRLPKAYRFEGQEEVAISRNGQRVILEGGPVP